MVIALMGRAFGILSLRTTIPSIAIFYTPVAVSSINSINEVF
jgi:ABC-type proline/glycine betaine transport system permease subunit